MKTLQIILMLVLIVSCGDKKHSSKSSIGKPFAKPHPIKKSFTFETYQKKLTSKGIHFARLSQLQDIKRPLTIYCSNTVLLNHEKIEELLIFSTILQELTITKISIDKIVIEKQLLLNLILEAMKSLEVEPYSSTCPKIYLSIQDIL